MRKIDGKYKTDGNITKLDGTPIPDDEPLILFRSKDRLLPELLEHYWQSCKEAGSPQRQLDLVKDRIKEVRAWQTANPDKLKIPD